MLLKKSFFWRKGKSCYNLLQQVTMRYKRLQKQRSPGTSLTVAQKFFFFSKGGISCYNLLQQFTIGFKKLQKQRNPSTGWKCPKSSFFLKEVISCYNVLQRVTMCYKRLQKTGMYTTSNIAQGIYFLKEGEKLL